MPRCAVLLAMVAFLDPRTAASSAENLSIPAAFHPGETITFRMKWKASPLLPAMTAGDLTVRFAGEARFDGRPVYAVEGLAASAPGFVYSAKDYFISYFTPGEFQTVHTRNLLQEQDQKIQQLIYFYPETKHLWLKEWTRDLKANGPAAVSRNELHWGVPSPLHDAATLMCSVRWQARQNSLPYTTRACWLARIKQITLEEAGEETLDTVLGSVRARKYNIRNLFGNLMEKKDDYFFIWATPDERNIPLKIQAKVKYGHVDGELLRYEPERRDSLIPADIAWLVPPPDVRPPIAGKLAGPAGKLPAPEMVRIPGGTYRMGARKAAIRRLHGHGGPLPAGPLRGDQPPVPGVRPRHRPAGARHPAVRLFPEEVQLEDRRLRGVRPAGGALPLAGRPLPRGPGGPARGAGLLGGRRRLRPLGRQAAAHRSGVGVGRPRRADRRRLSLGPRLGARAGQHRRERRPGHLAGGIQAAGRNGYGLFDMSGNAAEWVADWFGNGLPSGRNPSGPGKRQVQDPAGRRLAAHRWRTPRSGRAAGTGPRTRTSTWVSAAPKTCRRDFTRRKSASHGRARKIASEFNADQRRFFMISADQSLDWNQRKS